MTEAEYLNRYKPVQRLFEGLFTTVDLVTDLWTGEKRVLKASDITKYPGRNSQQLFNELVFHGLIASPFVVRKHFSFQVGHTLYVVLEYVENGDLFHFGWITKRPMSDTFIRKVIFQTCKALEAVHRKGLIHRDLKPENLLLTASFDVKLCDFGWCCEADDHLANCENAGTLAYMSPEALQSLHQTPASDVWALAILLYEMYHLREPFTGSTDEERLRSIMTTRPVFDSSFPPEARDIFDNCAQVEAQNRKPLSWILAHPFLHGVAATSPSKELLYSNLYRTQKADLGTCSINPSIGIASNVQDSQTKTSPYAQGLASSVSSIELSVQNLSSTYAPLLRSTRKGNWKREDGSLDRELSIQYKSKRGEFDCDLEWSDALIYKSTRVIKETPPHKYRPISVSRERNLRAKNSTTSSEILRSNNVHSKNDNGLKNLAKAADKDLELNKRNSSLETASVSGVDSTVGRITTSDIIMKRHLNIYEPVAPAELPSKDTRAPYLKLKDLSVVERGRLVNTGTPAKDFSEVNTRRMVPELGHSKHSKQIINNPLKQFTYSAREKQTNSISAAKDEVPIPGNSRVVISSSARNSALNNLQTNLLFQQSPLQSSTPTVNDSIYLKPNFKPLFSRPERRKEQPLNHSDMVEASKRKLRVADTVNSSAHRAIFKQGQPMALSSLLGKHSLSSQVSGEGWRGILASPVSKAAHPPSPANRQTAELLLRATHLLDAHQVTRTPFRDFLKTRSPDLTSNYHRF